MHSEQLVIAFAIRHILNTGNIEVIKRVRSGKDALSIFYEFANAPMQQGLLNCGKVITPVEALKIAEAELLKIEKQGYCVISIWDCDYPQRLREIYDPPLMFYYRGDISIADEKIVAIVGTRSCTSYGKKMALDISRGLSTAGIVIASGMAQGIDRFAHCGALSSNGRTIAVLGCGLDIVYPRSNCDIYYSIKKSGLLLSEYPPGYPPFKQNFPLRNRLISGISDGVIIVEASIRSGALITAALALDQGRTVGAVPGNVTSRKSLGTNALIKNGAPLISSWQEAVEEIYGIDYLLKININQAPEIIETNDNKIGGNIEKITSALLSGPLSAEQIASELGLNYSDVILSVVDMEFRGMISRRSDLLYELI